MQGHRTGVDLVHGSLDEVVRFNVYDKCLDDLVAVVGHGLLELLFDSSCYIVLLLEGVVEFEFGNARSDHCVALKMVHLV